MPIINNKGNQVISKRNVLVVSVILVFAIWFTGRACLYHGTVFASGYREDVFHRLKIGVTRTDVIKMLGKPLKIEDGYANSELGIKATYVQDMIYTRQVSDDSWWLVRSVLIDKKTQRVCYIEERIREP